MEIHRQRRRRFNDSFKLDAVSLVLETGRSISNIARMINVSEGTLGKWVRDEKYRQAQASIPLKERPQDERVKPIYLRRKVYELRVQIKHLR